MVIGALCGIVIPECGDDDNAATSDMEAYCAAISELGDRLPTGEEMSMILDVAPGEIAAELDVVLGAVRESGEAAFEDPDDVDGTSDEIDPDAQRVDVVATEYAFEFSPPDAGAVSFLMANEGSEIHEVLLARFIGDATIEDAFASEDPEAEGLVETLGIQGPGGRWCRGGPHGRELGAGPLRAGVPDPFQRRRIARREGEGVGVHRRVRRHERLVVRCATRPAVPVGRRSTCRW